jgi:hypothetical protein
MKQAFVSFVALALIFVGGLASSKANGVASTSLFTVSMAGFPDSVKRGSLVTGTITISMAPTTQIGRTQVSYQLFVSTPFGDAPVKSGTFALRDGREKTIKISIPVTDAAAPGLYRLRLVVSVGNETASVTHDLTVG